jgi:isocitrate lyase
MNNETVIQLEAEELAKEWQSPRWDGIRRDYSAQDVIRLRGSLKIEYTLAARGADRLWTLMRELPYVQSLGAVTGNQAVQQVKAGLKAIYLSGWQVAGDNNLGETTGSRRSSPTPRPASAVRLTPSRS